MMIPLQRALERVESARADSDVSLFYELLFAGEFLIKLTAAALVAAVQDDRDANRYRVQHKLVRADGIGEWSQAIDDLLAGPASQFLVQEAKDDRRELTERLPAGTWQHESVTKLIDTLSIFSLTTELGTEKLAAKSWYDLFPSLRNKTRGHGSPRVSACSEAVVPLSRSVLLFAQNNPLLRRQWAYLRQNLSGKYHVVPLARPSTAFDKLARAPARDIDDVYEEGVYIDFGSPKHVSLVSTDAELSDFFVPNGGFNGKFYEEHSPLTDSKRQADADAYLAPATDRPESETTGHGGLQPVGNVWTNLPPPPDSYIKRPELEISLANLLTNDRHPIVTLVGRGGIGKTSLALRVLHEMTVLERFGAMIWFSARDIDLTQSGPKLTRPDVLTELDISTQFVDMLEPANRKRKEFRPSQFMSENMRKSSIEPSILFIFDNFETVRNPIDLFNWIDTNIRLPNKVLITTRFRDFKADYPIEVGGMGEAEVNSLIDISSARLGTEHLFDANVRRDIFEQSDGHPYVVKIVVGEISDRGRPSKPERIIANKEDILQALFERTFGNLSAGAKRVFLTLCGWRSYIPQVALEALVYRNQNETLSISNAIDELDRMSLIQRRRGGDEQDFVTVPLAASLFGQRKLATSPIRTAIELDIRFLQELGPTTAISVSQGVLPRLKKLAQGMAAKVSDGRLQFSEAKSLLEFIAARIPEAWLLLADLSADAPQASAELEREFLRRYLEAEPFGASAKDVWERLGSLYRAENNVLAAADAFSRAFQSGDVPYYLISNIANWLNNQKDSILKYDIADRCTVLSPFIQLMERRISEAGATDLSRLAWLHLHTGDNERSRQLAELGLDRDSSNVHCKRLIERLNKERSH